MRRRDVMPPNGLRDKIDWFPINKKVDKTHSQKKVLFARCIGAERTNHRCEIGHPHHNQHLTSRTTGYDYRLLDWFVHVAMGDCNAHTHFEH